MTPTRESESEERRLLMELVALKDIKDKLDKIEPPRESPTRNYYAEELREDYDRRKPLAWSAARALLAQPEEQNAAGADEVHEEQHRRHSSALAAPAGPPGLLETGIWQDGIPATPDQPAPPYTYTGCIYEARPKAGEPNAAWCRTHGFGCPNAAVQVPVSASLGADAQARAGSHRRTSKGNRPPHRIATESARPMKRLERIRASIRAAHALGRVWEASWMPLEGDARFTDRSGKPSSVRRVRLKNLLQGEQFELNGVRYEALRQSKDHKTLLARRLGGVLRLQEWLSTATLVERRGDHRTPLAAHPARRARVK